TATPFLRAGIPWSVSGGYPGPSTVFWAWFQGAQEEGNIWGRSSLVTRTTWAFFSSTSFCQAHKSTEWVLVTELELSVKLENFEYQNIRLQAGLSICLSLHPHGELSKRGLGRDAANSQDLEGIGERRDLSHGHLFPQATFQDGCQPKDSETERAVMV
ncbi:hypothetical protein Cadr_000021802, partial [Camelus dromedarius]